MSQRLPPGTPPTEPPRPESDKPASERPSWKGWIILALLLAGFWAWQYFGGTEEAHPEVTYTQLYRFAEEGKLETVTVRGQHVTGKLKKEEQVEGRTLKTFKSMVPAQEDKDLLPLLRSKNVEVSVKSEEQPFALQLLVNLVPFALIIGLWIWFSRRAQRMLGPGGPFGASGMLKSRSHRFEKEGQVAVKFDDVAGLAAAKQDLREVVEFLRHPEQFRRLGGKVPRGILLVGPPGTGKTLLARAVAGEAQVPFFSINGNPTEVRDWRIPSDGPAGAKPVTKKAQYDDLNRVSRVDYQYEGGDDTWTSRFAAENSGQADLQDPRRAKPSPHVDFPKRLEWQTFEYDWLGNTKKTDDDASGFYDRSLGPITNDTSKPYQLKSADNTALGGPRTGSLETQA